MGRPPFGRVDRFTHRSDRPQAAPDGTTVVRPPISSSVSRPAETVSRIRGAGAPAWPTNRTRIVGHGAVEAGDGAILEGFGAQRNIGPRKSVGQLIVHMRSIILHMRR